MVGPINNIKSFQLSNSGFEKTKIDNTLCKANQGGIKDSRIVEISCQLPFQKKLLNYPFAMDSKEGKKVTLGSISNLCKQQGKNNFYLMGSSLRYFRWGEAEIPNFFKSGKDLDLLWLFDLPQDLAESVKKRRSLEIAIGTLYLKINNVKNEEEKLLSEKLKDLERKKAELEQSYAPFVREALEFEIKKVEYFLLSWGGERFSHFGLDAASASASLSLEKVDINIKSVTDWDQIGFNFLSEVQILRLNTFELLVPHSYQEEPKVGSYNLKRPLNFCRFPDPKSVLKGCLRITDQYPIGKINFLNSVKEVLFDYGPQEKWVTLLNHLCANHISGKDLGKKRVLEGVFWQVSLFIRFLEKQENQSSFALKHLEELQQRQVFGKEFFKEDLKLPFITFLDQLLEGAWFFPITNGKKIQCYEDDLATYVTFKFPGKEITLAIPKLDLSKFQSGNLESYLGKILDFNDQEIDVDKTRERLEKSIENNPGNFFFFKFYEELYPDLFAKACFSKQIPFNPKKHDFRSFFDFYRSQGEVDTLYQMMCLEEIPFLRQDQFLNAFLTVFKGQQREIFPQPFLSKFIDLLAEKNNLQLLDQLDSLFIFSNFEAEYLEKRFSKTGMGLFFEKDSYCLDFIEKNYEQKEVLTQFLKAYSEFFPENKNISAKFIDQISLFLKGRQGKKVFLFEIFLLEKSEKKEEKISELLEQAFDFSLQELSEEKQIKIFRTYLGKEYLIGLKQLLNRDLDYQPGKKIIYFLQDWMIQNKKDADYFLLRFEKQFDKSFLKNVFGTSFSIEQFHDFDAWFQELGFSKFLAYLSEQWEVLDSRLQKKSFIKLGRKIQCEDQAKDFLVLCKNKNLIKEESHNELEKIYKFLKKEVQEENHPLFNAITFYLAKKERIKIDSNILFRSFLFASRNGKGEEIKSIEQAVFRKNKATSFIFNSDEQEILIPIYLRHYPESKNLKKILKEKLNSNRSGGIAFFNKLFQEGHFVEPMRPVIFKSKKWDLIQSLWNKETSILQDDDLSLYIENSFSSFETNDLKEKFIDFSIRNGLLTNRRRGDVLKSFLEENSIENKFFENLSKKLSFFQYLEVTHSFCDNKKLSKKYLDGLSLNFEDFLDQKNRETFFQFCEKNPDFGKEKILIQMLTKVLCRNEKETLTFYLKNKESFEVVQDSEINFVKGFAEHLKGNYFELNEMIVPFSIFSKNPKLRSEIKPDFLDFFEGVSRNNFSRSSNFDRIKFISTIVLFLRTSKKNYSNDIFSKKYQLFYLSDEETNLLEKVFLNFYEKRKIKGKEIIQQGISKKTENLDEVISLATLALLLIPIEKFKKDQFDITDELTSISLKDEKNKILFSAFIYLYFFEKKCLEKGEPLEARAMRGIRFELLRKKMFLLIFHTNKKKPGNYLVSNANIFSDVFIRFSALFSTPNKNVNEEVFYLTFNACYQIRFLQHLKTIPKNPRHRKKVRIEKFEQENAKCITDLKNKSLAPFYSRKQDASILTQFVAASFDLLISTEKEKIECFINTFNQCLKDYGEEPVIANKLIFKDLLKMILEGFLFHFIEENIFYSKITDDTYESLNTSRFNIHLRGKIPNYDSLVEKNKNLKKSSFLKIMGGYKFFMYNSEMSPKNIFQVFKEMRVDENRYKKYIELFDGLEKNGTPESNALKQIVANRTLSAVRFISVSEEVKRIATGIFEDDPQKFKPLLLTRKKMYQQRALKTAKVITALFLVCCVYIVLNHDFNSLYFSDDSERPL